MTLYEIQENYMHLMQLMEDPEVDQEAIDEAEKELKDDLFTKADAYAKIIKTWKGNISSLKEEIKRMQQKVNLLELNIEQLQGNLENAMRISGNTKFKTALFSFGIQKAGSKPLEIDVLPIELPEEFVEYEIKVDKRKLADALKLDPEKYSEYCHFGEQKEVLRIR